MKTYTYRSTTTGPGPLQDFLAGVINTDTYGGAVIRVHQVALYPTSGTSLTGVAPIRLSRITAVTGGTAVTPVKHDTGAANLPSEVVFVNNPTAVTETDTLANRIDLQNAPAVPPLAATTLPIVNRQGGGPRTSPLDLSRFYSSRLSNPIEPIILRPGEGIALILVDYGNPHLVSYSVEVTNTATGATYTFSTIRGLVPRVKGNAFNALFNGAGSGVTLEVRMIEMPSYGSSSPPQYRLCRIAGIPGGATVETPIAHDTRYPAPPWVTCAKGPAVADLWGRNHGLPLIWEVDGGAQVAVAIQHRAGRFRSRALAPWGMDAGTTLAPPAGQVAQALLYSDIHGLGTITLGPGEGMAVLTGNGIIDDTVFNVWIVEITFSVQDNQRFTQPGAVYVA